MGWWWNTKSTSPSNTASSDDLPTTPPSAEPQLQPEPMADPVVPQTLSREEQANQDLMELLRELQAESDKDRESRSSPSYKDRILPDAFHTESKPIDISPDSLYPSEIHCRSAFDYALFCQSFGGQFVNIYRYGSFRSCSNHWDDFWLCMRTRNWDQKDREVAIREHYRKKSIKYKTGLSSEDVWEVRTTPVKDAFQDSLEELEKKIEEWKRRNPDVQDPWDKQAGTTFRDPKLA